MNRYLNPTIDVVFKLLLGSPETKECLIALLTAVLRPASPIADVEVINPEIAKENIDDKGIVLDVLVMSDDSGCIRSSSFRRFTTSGPSARTCRCI